MARIAFLIICAALIVGCGTGEKPVSTDSNSQAVPGVDPKVDFVELKKEDIEPGSGVAAEKGDVVLVMYRGTFKDGKEFDSNMDAKMTPNPEKPPYAVTLGEGAVIKGWDEGLVGTKEGTVRKLFVPSKMAYGPGGRDSIPPNSDLLFTVKVVKVFKKGVEPEIEVKDIKVGTGPGITEANTVVMTYVGTLLNGKIFDKKENVTMPIKRFHVGLKEAVLGMKKGGKRRVTVPPNVLSMAFSIPREQVTIFDFELLEVK